MIDLLALGKEPAGEVAAALFLGAAKGCGGDAIAAFCVASVRAPAPTPLTKFLRENFIYCSLRSVGGYSLFGQSRDRLPRSQAEKLLSVGCNDQDSHLDHETLSDIDRSQPSDASDIGQLIISKGLTNDLGSKDGECLVARYSIRHIYSFGLFLVNPVLAELVSVLTWTRLGPGQAGSQHFDGNYSSL